MGSKKSELGRILAGLRVMRGWTQTKLARRSGVAKAQISRYERGVTWPHLTLDRLLKGLQAERHHMQSMSAVLRELEAGVGSRHHSLSNPYREPWPQQLARTILWTLERKELLAPEVDAAEPELQRGDDPEVDRLAREAAAMVERLVRLHFQWQRPWQY